MGLLSLFKKGAEAGYTQPIFIGGEGRSGTTLIRVMLNSHPNIACGPESQLFRDPKVPELFEYLSATYEGRIREYSSQPRRYLAGSFRAMINAFFEGYADKQNKKRWAEKSPLNILVIDFLAELFEGDFKFIHTIRDGRDVASSILSMDWGPSTVKQAAERWKQIIDTGKAHRGKKYYFEVRYEDLIEDPEKKTREICKFINEEFHPDMLDFHKQKHKFGSDESSNDQVAKPIYKSAIGRWKKDLTAKQKEEYMSVAGGTLAELGYK